MSLQMLEENWLRIVEMVIKPLWEKRFKDPYVFLKMDYDDFESLAGEELSKAFRTYNSEKSNIFTFSHNVLVNKANTEIRNKNREKRMGDVIAESLYAKMSEENDMTLESVVENTISIEDSYCCDVQDVKGEVFKLLRPKEVKIIELTLLGFDDKTIAKALKMSSKDVLGLKRSISESSAVTRIFKMSGYLGGDEE